MAAPCWEPLCYAATVNPNAIPWVLLSATFEGGAGIFANTKFIQRVNTVGGKAPSEDGTCDWAGFRVALHSRLLLLPGRVMTD